MPRAQTRPPKSAPPSLLCKGAQQLAGISASHGELAAKLSVSKSAVVGWRSGRRRPSPRDRERIARILGIPTGTWGDTPAIAPTAPGIAPAKASRPADPTAGRRATLTEVRATLAEIDELLDDPALDSVVREKLLGRRLSALRLYGDLERNAALDEDRFIERNPRWTLFAETISAAVVGCNRCANLVCSALETLDT